MFEHACLSPADHLAYLIEQADDPDLIAHENLTDRFSPATRQKRRALSEGNESVKTEALKWLTAPRGRCPGRGGCHVLEGITKVDWALFGDRVTVFVEGKRTEPHLTDKTDWHRHRNPVVRNLDCLRVVREREATWFVLLVVEGDTAAETEAEVFDTDMDSFSASVPPDGR